MDRRPLKLIKGTLDVLILKSLSWGPLHGYAISRWVRTVTDAALDIQEGVLYPALHRLERRGYVRSAWSVSDSNRRVKSYELTARGEARLANEESGWARYAEAVGKVLDAPGPARESPR